MRFRRNAKTTGRNPALSRRQVTYTSSRPQAFSYSSNRSEQEYNLGRAQPREQDMRKRQRLVRYWRQRLGVLFAGLIIIVCLLDILHLSSMPKVIALTGASNSSFLQPSNVYQQAAAKLFAGSIFNANKITINTDQIKQKLKAQFPELSDVSITLPLIGHRPIVYIAPSSPSLVLATHSGDFVLDSSGRALLPASQVPGLAGLQLTTVTDQSGLSVHTNQVVLPRASVAFIQTVIGELKAKNVAFNSLTLPAAAYELDLYPSGVGYYVKFNLHTTDAMQQVGSYLAVRQRLQSQNITPTAYIDVRVDGRAYYK